MNKYGIIQTVTHWNSVIGIQSLLHAAWGNNTESFSQGLPYR